MNQIEHAPSESIEQSRLQRFGQFAGRLIARRVIEAQIPQGDIYAENVIAVTPESEAAVTEQLPDTRQPENYDEEMTVWKETLRQELSTATEELEINNSRAQRSWDLYSKMYEAARDGRTWADEGKLARQGIVRRYGSDSELRSRENALARTVRRRKEQLASAENSNTVLEYVDEIDPSAYRRYLGEPGKLGDNFNLPKTASLTSDPEEAARLLNTLPFVAWEDVRQPDSRQHPKIVLDGHFDFPTERIIGVASFESWAGRGERQGSGPYATLAANGKGDKVFTPLVLSGIERTSRGAITDYAHADPAKLKEIGGIEEITIIRDAAGEYWGIATIDGSHRAAAAKLRGDATMAVSRIEINADQDMPTIDYSVRDRFSHQ